MPILVVIMSLDEAPALTRWGYHLAQAHGRGLTLLCAEHSRAEISSHHVELAPDGGCVSANPLLSIVGETLRELKLHPLLDQDGYYQQSGAEDQQSEGEPLPEVEISLRHLANSNREAAVLAELRRVQVSFLIVGQHGSDRNDPDAQLARTLFEAAPAPTLLLRPGGNQGRRCRRILVPTRGGENAAVAMQIFSRFVIAHGGVLVPLFVEPEGGELAADVGKHMLDSILAEAKVPPDPAIEPRVIVHDDPFAAIAEVAGEGCDLLLVGASNVSTLRRTLFSTVSDRLLEGTADGDGMALGVIRAARPLSERVRDGFDRFVSGLVPQLERDNRIALFEGLQKSSQWSFDFCALILMSTGIAALGLLQDSTAVVIGAMLVAPLMSPILGAGLALVQGNLPLIRASAKAIALGFLAALITGFVCGLLVPIGGLTGELAARGGPTLLDMGVALASGIAAAYCLGRPGLSPALPGVAIAAALVPPIATVGISLSLGEAENALGAATLFSTNVVAIVLGAAATFYTIGVRANRSRSRGLRWVRRTVAGLMLAAVFLSLPLGAILISQLTRNRLQSRNLPTEIRAGIAARLDHTDIRLSRTMMTREDDITVLHIYLIAPHPIPPDLARDLADLARAQLSPDVRIAVHTELEIDFAPPTTDSGTPTDAHTGTGTPTDTDTGTDSTTPTDTDTQPPPPTDMPVPTDMPTPMDIRPTTPSDPGIHPPPP